MYQFAEIPRYIDITVVPSDGISSSEHFLTPRVSADIFRLSIGNGWKDDSVAVTRTVVSIYRSQREFTRRPAARRQRTVVARNTILMPNSHRPTRSTKLFCRIASAVWIGRLLRTCSELQTATDCRQLDLRRCHPATRRRQFRCVGSAAVNWSLVTYLSCTRDALS